MEVYNVSFLENGVYQSAIMKTTKGVYSIELWFRKNKPMAYIIGTNVATEDDIKPGKPIITIM